MAIEAPASKYKLKSIKIYILVCIVAAIIFGYDGYFSKYEWSKRQAFYQKNVIDNGGIPNSTMKFNRTAPPILLAVAIFFIARFFMVKNRKLLADETGIVLDNRTISYDSIEKIDKTYFDSKGYFIVTYKNEQNSETDLKISDNDYENMQAVMDHLVAKIS